MIDAGTSGVISPSSVFFTACALRESGTINTSSNAFIIWRIDIEIARVGTSSMLANHPSPTCCLRHASSRFTRM